MVYFNQILHTYACQHIEALAFITAFFGGRGFAKHQFGRSWSVSENAYNC